MGRVVDGPMSRVVKQLELIILFIFVSEVLVMFSFYAAERQ